VRRLWLFRRVLAGMHALARLACSDGVPGWVADRVLMPLVRLLGSLAQRL
jgi:hypothetical protein